MERNELIEYIIIRHLNNEASPEEEATLNEWLKSDENKEEYSTIVKIWNDTAVIIPEQNFDTNAAWQSVEKKIQIPLDSPPARLIPLLSWKKIAVAAAVLLTITTSILFYLNRNKEVPLQNILATQSNQHVLLPDGSEVLLRKGSEISYANDFDIEERKLRLKGEAYFEIKHNEGKPFRIVTNKSIIEDLGTSFLVRSAGVTEQVMVNAGKVKFISLADTTKNIILSKGQKAILTDNDFTVDSIRTNNILAWQNKKLVFENTPLKHVVEDLSNFYQVDILLSPEISKSSEQIIINTRFEQQDLQQVLNELQLITGLTIKKEGDKIILSPKQKQ
ncbi:MAG: FecR family protein [Sphingobacteriales bacterium]|nr:MAG: FecR family protein [Sphingobacteriales bacterium]